jgi:hypothetical protein
MLLPPPLLLLLLPGVSHKPLTTRLTRSSVITTAEDDAHALLGHIAYVMLAVQGSHM